MAASACSVPDESAISGFGLAMSRSRGRGLRPGPLLSTADFAARRARALLNGSLTIIVLTPLTTFSARGCFACGWNRRTKYKNSLGYSHRDVGSRLGPRKAREAVPRAFAMAGAGRVRTDIGAGPDRHARPVQSGPRQLRRAAGQSAAQGRGQQDHR